MSAPCWPRGRSRCLPGRHAAAPARSAHGAYVRAEIRVTTWTKARVLTALLRKLLAEVHFADPETGFAAAVARMLTPIVRWQSEGTMHAPITLVARSDTQVGATSLLRLCHAAATGRPPVTSAMPTTDEEMLKKVTARVIADPASAWLLDNASQWALCELAFA